MKYNKITYGFVIQTFDTALNKCTGQEFIAGDEVDYEDEGDFNYPLNNYEEEVCNIGTEKELYEPFNMEQP